MQIVVTCTGTSPLLILRVSGREPKGGKWLVKLIPAGHCVVPCGNTGQIYRRSVEEAFCLVVKLGLTTFSSFEVPSQSSLGIAAHSEPHTQPTMCFFCLPWPNLSYSTFTYSPQNRESHRLS